MGFLLNVCARGARRVVKSLFLAQKLAASDREVELRFLLQKSSPVGGIKFP